MESVLTETLERLDHGECQVNPYYIISAKVGEEETEQLRRDPLFGPIELFLEHYCDAVEHKFDHVVGQITTDQGRQMIADFLTELTRGRIPSVSSEVHRHCSYLH